MQATLQSPSPSLWDRARPGIRALAASPWPWLILFALGAAARCRQFIGCGSYWYDEAYLLLDVFDRSYRELLGPLPFKLVIPPLFLWIERAMYLLAGRAERAMRLPAFLAGMGGLLIMIPLARRYLDFPGWMWAVALCALSGHGLDHACEVRPYASDMLIAASVLLATDRLLTAPIVPEHSTRVSGLALLFLGSLAPWLSFPSVFVLAGASLALFLDVVRCRGLSRLAFWLIFNALLMLSLLLLWYLDARFLYYPGLTEHWGPKGWRGFPDMSSAATALDWTWKCIVGIGNYANSGMGIPLALLALAGCLVTYGQSRVKAVLLFSPVAVALLAACLGRYPLSNRTVFFLLPCLWILAGQGMVALIDRMGPRWSWVGAILMACPLATGAIDMAKNLAHADAPVEYREAFAYVHEHWEQNDSIWVLHPEVYEVYYGNDPALLGCNSPPDAVERAAHAGRLWMIRPPLGQAWNIFPELFASLDKYPGHPVTCHRVKGLEIVLYGGAK